MRRLAEAASEAAVGVLHGADRVDEALAIRRDILAQEGEGGEAPVEDPGTAGVRRHEGSRELSKLLMQEVDMAATVQMGEAVGVAGGVFLGPEEGQTFVNGCVLHARRLCVQVVVEEGLRGEYPRYRRLSSMLRRTCCCCCCCCGCHLDAAGVAGEGGLVCVVDTCSGGGGGGAAAVVAV